MSMIRKRLPEAAVTSALALIFALSLGASADTPGAKVEVREGDLWSKVTVVRKEGRRTLIRYDDNTEEWVTADRMREVSSTSAAPATPSTQSATAAKPWLTVGSTVEYKSPLRWHQGQITDIQRGWYLVKEDRSPMSFWCEPWSLRVPGSNYDIDADTLVLARRPVMRGKPAPSNPPGPSPRQIGTARQDVAAASSSGGASPEIAADGTPPVTKIDLGAAADPQPGKMTPLNLATTRPTMEFRSATVRNFDRIHRVQSVAVCRDTPGIVVFECGWTASEAVEIIRFDSSTGRTLNCSTLSKNSQHVLGAANSGKVIFTANSNSRKTCVYGSCTEIPTR